MASEMFGIAGWFMMDELFSWGSPEPKELAIGIRKFEQGYQVPFGGYCSFSDGTKIINGNLIDVYGPSSIAGELDIQRGSLLFRKKYDGNKNDFINYEFTKQGDLWVGRFKDRLSSDGKYTHSGQPAQLTLTEIADASLEQLKRIRGEAIPA